MQQGWVKLHRRLLDSPNWRDHNYSRLLITVLLLASYSPRQLSFGGKLVQAPAGNLFTTDRDLAVRSGLGKKTVRRILLEMQRNHTVDLHRSKSGTLILVRKWSHYQGDTPSLPRREEPPTNQDGTTAEPQRNRSYKEDKKKNESTLSREGVIAMATSLFPQLPNCEKLASDFFDHYESTGWLDANGNRVVSITAKFRRWVAREVERAHKQSENPRNQFLTPINIDDYVGIASNP